ncbi:MAG: hypothetical protein N6V49_14335 [Serratia symbiotica]|nr:hypothetical protein [Serratia symbiotica]
MEVFQVKDENSALLRVSALLLLLILLLLLLLLFIDTSYRYHLLLYRGTFPNLT